MPRDKKVLTPTELLTMLGETPSRIAEAVGDATAHRLRSSPAVGEWSANEILAHLRACADVGGRCITTILTGEAPTIRAVSPRRWIESTDYVEQEFRRSLSAFTAQRDELLAILRALSARDWSLSATITGAGKPLVRSVHDYAQWLARHEQPHLKQIERAVEGAR